MIQLDYPKYVIDGGDFGGVILRYQAHLYPDNVVSVSSNFWVVQPTDDDMRRFTEGATTEDETAYINQLSTYILQQSGYRILQEFDPLTAAYPLTDSPIGMAMWIYSLMSRIVDPSDFEWTPQEIITWSLMYTIQGPYSGLRMYKEMNNEGALAGFDFGIPPLVHQPVMISEFPYDCWYRIPLDWAQRGGNVRLETSTTESVTSLHMKCQNCWLKTCGGGMGMATSLERRS